MMRIAFRLYPALVIAAALFAIIKGHEVKAGQVRQLALSPDDPGVVHLAFGRTTAISFSVRPEKVVPGSPQAIEVNFLGKDITIRPLTSKPGNLLVYTKTSRFVILLQLGNDRQYDDVVKIAPSFGKAPLRLLEDTYRIVQLDVEIRKRNGSVDTKKIPASLISAGRAIEGNDLAELLAPFTGVTCKGCVVRKTENGVRLNCTDPIREIRCATKGASLTLREVEK